MTSSTPSPIENAGENITSIFDHYLAKYFSIKSLQRLKWRQSQCLSWLKKKCLYFLGGNYMLEIVVSSFEYIIIWYTTYDSCRLHVWIFCQLEMKKIDSHTIFSFKLQGEKYTIYVHICTFCVPILWIRQKVATLLLYNRHGNPNLENFISSREEKSRFFSMVCSLWKMTKLSPKWIKISMKKVSTIFWYIRNTTCQSLRVNLVRLKKLPI